MADGGFQKRYRSNHQIDACRSDIHTVGGRVAGYVTHVCLSFLRYNWGSEPHLANEVDEQLQSIFHHQSSG
jgi:hypothetical protein